MNDHNEEDYASATDSTIVNADSNNGGSKENGVDNLLSNGVFEITELSSDEETETQTTSDEKIKTVSNQERKPSFKKEELTEEKFLNDPDDMLFNNDETDSNEDQFGFNVDSNEQLANNFLDDEASLENLAEFEGNETEEVDFMDDTEDTAAEAETAEPLAEENEEAGLDMENEPQEGEETSTAEPPSEESTSKSPTPDETNVPPASDPKSAVEAGESEPESHDVKRPSSRESTASNASSSSERTLTIRSASDLNKLVVGGGDAATVKREEGSGIAPPEPTTVSEKPAHSGGLSILNPSQLGATNNAAGENLLQNVNFTQPSDQMMGYMGPGIHPLQCDVCETQFPDNMMLEEHKANAGHYKCHFAAECAALVFQSVVEMSTHQQTMHGMIPQSPVQQLAHQVQSLPIRYQMDQTMQNNYPSMPPYPQPGPQAVRSVVPQGYPPQGNVQMRPFNSVQPPPPRLQIGSIRGNVQMGNQQPNPMKRAATMPQTRLAPPKRMRTDYSRNGDTDCKVVSIQKPDNTDDVVAQLSKSITITARQDNQKKNDTAAVTNMLANRGITVSSVPSKQNRNANAVAMLNLNSAVSLIPTNNGNNRQSAGFAVPQGRVGARQGMTATNASSPRLQTVDLTGPDPPRNRQGGVGGRATNRFQCQICDRTFFNQDQLNQHMITHRSSSRKQLPFKCNMCTAQYPTSQGLQQHKQTFHRDAVGSTNEMVIPIVDLKQPGSLQRLQNLGINHIIPLNALGSQHANGNFGIPVLPFSSDRTTINNMTNNGISNILPVGPLKSLR